jgi:hypothetical protein
VGRWHGSASWVNVIDDVSTQVDPPSKSKSLGAREMDRRVEACPAAVGGKTYNVGR